MKLSTAIRVARISRDIKQKDLAAKTGIASNYLSMIECGRKNPRWTTIVRIAKAINIKPSTMLRDVDE